VKSGAPSGAVRREIEPRVRGRLVSLQRSASTLRTAVAPAFVACATALASLGAGCFTEKSQPPLVQYRLEWDFSGVDRDLESGTWSVTNNKSYEVTVESGHLVAYSVAFLPCDIVRRRRSGAANAGADARGGPLSRLGPRIVWAGHGDPFFNPVQTEPPVVESLTSGASSDVGSFSPEPVRYCQVHYVIARAPADAVGLPEEIDMVGVTAHVEGFYRRLPDGSKTAFTIHSPSANAVLEDIFEDGTGPDDAQPGFDGSSARATAVVMREAANLFHDIDFENDGRHKIPWQFLKNVADGTTIRVDLGNVRGQG
jgi:hypothetical protein